jgi:hypothetical protein
MALLYLCIRCANVMLEVVALEREALGIGGVLGIR